MPFSCQSVIGKVSEWFALNHAPYPIFNLKRPHPKPLDSLFFDLRDDQCFAVPLACITRQYIANYRLQIRFPAT
jgi:hypothetical protein